MTRKDYKNLDDAICQFLATKDGHPTNSSALLELAGTHNPSSSALTPDADWRLIDRRMVAMRKAGRIKFVGNGRNNPSGKMHGWVVCIPDLL
jgi:glucokinase